MKKQEETRKKEIDIFLHKNFSVPYSKSKIKDSRKLYKYLVINVGVKREEIINMKLKMLGLKDKESLAFYLSI